MHRATLIGTCFVALTACGGATSTPAEGTVREPVGTAGQLAASHGYVYWSQRDAAASSGSPEVWSIRRLADAGGVPEVLVSGLGEPQGMAVDATDVYWTDSLAHSLLAVPVTGVAPGGTYRTVTSHLSSPTAVALVGRTAFVVNKLGSLVTSLWSVGLDDGVATQVPSGPAQSLATDGTALYFVTSDITCEGPSCAASTVERYAPGDAAPVAVLSSPQLVDEIAVSGGTLYYSVRGPSNQAPDELRSAALGGGAPATLGTAVAPFVDVAVTTGSVYWATSAGVWSAPLGGAGGATQVSTDEATALVGDDGGIFAVVTGPDGAMTLVFEGR